MRLWLIFLLLLLFSCNEESKKTDSSASRPDFPHARGYIVPKDSMARPVFIPVDESIISKIPAGKPTSYLIPDNVIPAGNPRLVQAGSPRIFIPGRDTFALPEKVPAKGKTVMAGIPEVVLVKDAYIKDQNPQNFSTFDKLQGLKHKTIQCMMQDRTGNLWFGTDGGGVSKYNGRTFTHFTVNEGLSGNFIWSMLEDKQGGLWFGSFGGGVCRYDGKTFTQFSKNNGLSDNVVLSMLEDRSGNIWLGTVAGGVNKFDGKNFTHYTTRQGLSNNIVTSILEDKRGNLWFGTDGGGVSRYSPGEGSAEGQFSHYTTEEGLSSNHVRCILEDRQGILWFGTDGGGISIFRPSDTPNKGNGYFTYFTEKEGLPSNFVWRMMEDNEMPDRGIIWIGTNGGGVCKYSPPDPGSSGTGTFSCFTEKEGLTNNYVLSILEDRSGNLWFGTGGGASKFGGKGFIHYTEREGLSKNMISAICEDQRGNLWFGTYGGGVNRYDGKSFSHYSEKQGFSKHDIRCILEDRNGNIWFGTEGNGVFRYTPPHSKGSGEGYFTHFTENEGLSKNVIFCIHEDKHGNIWFGTWGGGVSKYSPPSAGGPAGFTRYNEKQGLSNSDVRCILEDRNGNLWFGTWGGGVTKFRPNISPDNDGQFTHFTQKEGLSSNVVYSMLEDKRGLLWLGTYGGGICLYNGKNFSCITEKEGLSDNFVFGILEEKNKDICIGTRFGLNRISQEKLDVFLDKIRSGTLKDEDVFLRQYGYEDGFLGIGINEGKTMLQDRNGSIWIGSNGRLTNFHPEGIRPDSIAPVIQLTDIKIFNEHLAWPLLHQNQDSMLTLKNGIRVEGYRFSEVSRWYSIPENLSLAFSNNYLTFNFIGISMNQPKRMKYRYMLQGMDENWSGISLRNEATYGNIPPGSYTFLVKAMNGDGIWSKPFEYRFTIRPPWWKTWWAYTGFGLVLLTSGMGFVRYRERALRNRQKELEIKVEEASEQIRQQKEEEKKIILRMEEEKARVKDAFLADMSHEIRTPLNAVLGFHDLLKNTSLDQEQKKHVDIIGGALKNLNVIINDILDVSKLESGKLELEKRPFSISNLVHQVAQMHMARAKAKGLELLVRLDESVPAFVSGDETRLSQILINLVSNALKFTSQGSVEISVKELSRADSLSRLQFRVSDTGIGIAPYKLDKIFERFTQAEESTTRKYGGTGLGLNIVKSLVEVHRGRIEVESTPGKGSVFFFEIPYPIASAPDLVSENSSEPGLQAGALQGMKILLVEDNEYNQILARTLLERNGAQIEIASDGLKGLEALEKNTFDVVLMDIEMPGMNGLEATERIRQSMKLTLPIFGCSAHAQESEKNRCIESGMTGYISKPYTEQDLIAAILGSRQPGMAPW